MATSLNVSYVPITFKTLGGGLNTTSGPLGLQDNESSDLQNIEFNKFGSVLQRNGYTVLNTNVLTGTSQGLYWYNGPSTQYAITVNNGQIWKMDELDGTWDNVSGAVTLGGYFDTFTKAVLHCDGTDQGITFTESAAGKAVTNTETYDSYTVLMLHASGSNLSTTITDSSLGTHTVLAYGDAALRTAQSKFNGSSMYFGGGLAAGTVLYTRMDGADGIVTFTDIVGKTISNVSTWDSYTVLCSHFSGANLAVAYSDPIKGAYTFSGTAMLSTAQSKFFNSSLLLDGNSDFVTLADSADYYFATGDFTIDLWFRTSDLTSANGICGQYADANNFWDLFVATNGAVTLQTYFASTEKNIYTGAGVIAINNWYHIAIVRASNVHKFYVNGTYVSTTDALAASEMANIAGTLTVGAVRRDSGNWSWANGYIDEFRISKGIARWTSSFTVPAYPYNRVAVSTAQYKLGTASGWFDGSGSVLTLADSADWDVGTGDFCADFWVRFDNLNIRHCFFNANSEPLAVDCLELDWDPGNLVYCYVGDSAADSWSWTPTVNTWYHLAVTRSGTGLQLYINGVGQGIKSAPEDITGGTGGFRIGRTIGSTYKWSMGGYIDEFRFIKGSAVYSGDFSVPTTQYPQNDYLTTLDSGDFNFGTGNFTIDTWFNLNSLPTSDGSDHCICGQYQDGNNEWKLVLQSDNKVNVYFVIGSATKGNYVTTAALPSLSTNTWYHLAAIRSSTTASVYFNGTSQALTEFTAFGANDVGNVSAVFTIGSRNSAQCFNGYLDEMRVSKGVVRWNSDFTPPYSPYGQVRTITSQYKFLPSGAEFKGYERLSLADSDDWYFGTGNFTIDCWFKWNNYAGSGGYQVICGQRSGAADYWWVGRHGTANTLIIVFISGGVTKGRYECSFTPTNGQWYHLAFVRDSTVGKIFVNGALQSMTEVTAFAANDVGNVGAILDVGQQNNTYFLEGYLDELRISKGVARWTADFTPPTQKYGTLLKQDFDTFLGYVVGADPANVPWYWGEGLPTATSLTCVTGLTGAKFTKKYQNYLFLANVTVSGVKYDSRIYWSDLLSISSWQAYNYIDIAKNDGDEISGIKELGDRLVVYKRNSIYLVIFTGDADIPFVVQKSNSAVGCCAPFSIQVVENGHVFCAYDGIYYFDGSNSYKASDRITDTFLGANFSQITESTSLYQQVKNRYLLSVPSGTSLYNNFVIGWNYFLNSWTKYVGMSASSMAIFLVDNVEERPYFADYSGYTYRMDYGDNDYPCGSKTAIDTYWYSNWKAYDTLCDKKGVPHIYITLRNESETNLTVKYAYDFYNGDQYSHTFSAVSTQSVTSHTVRRDLIGRGRFVRLGITHNNTDTSFRLDGLGTYVTKEGMS